MPEQQQVTKNNYPYKTGDGSYNRESGNKTLVFVGICILLVVILSVISFVMLIQNARVIIK